MSKAIKKPCKVCSATITQKLRPGIGCCNCQDFYHFTCAKLEDQDIEYIESNPVGWLCPRCNKPQRRSFIIPRTPPKSTSSPEDLLRNTTDIRRSELNSKRSSQAKKQITPTAATTTSAVGTSNTKQNTKPSLSLANKKPVIAKYLRKSPVKNLGFAQRPSSDLIHPSVETTPSSRQSSKSPGTDQSHFKSEIDSIQRKITALQKNIEDLKEVISRKDKQIEDLDKSRVSKRIEIQGLNLTTTANPLAILKNLGEGLSCPIFPSEIVNSFVLTSSKGTKLVAEFSTDLKKELFIKAGRKFNREGGLFLHDNTETKIYINQQLTASQKSLLYNTKEFAKENKFKFVWIHRAQILLKKEESSLPLYISTFEDLAAIPTSSNCNDRNILSKC